jgi:hypothetical protein
MDFNQQLTVDLYIRADAPSPKRRDTIIERLEQLEQHNQISEFTIHPWPSAMSLDLVKHIDGEGILDVVHSFETWAAQHGLRLRPPFDVRTSHSTITDETDKLLVLPVMCVAAYTDGVLVGVWPCSDGESVCTVEDALDTIATGEPPISGLPPERDSANTESERQERSEIPKEPDPNGAMPVPNSTESSE